MEVGVCALCESFLTSPLEATRESFRRTLTLERTLEMLSTGLSVSSFNTMTLLCFKCSSILHTGLQVTSQILLLESRLRNLGARIRTSAVTQTCINNRLVRKSVGNQTPPDFSFSKFFSTSSKVSSANDKNPEAPDNKNEVKSEDTDIGNKTKETADESTNSEEFQLHVKRNSSRNPRSEKKNLKRTSNKTSLKRKLPPETPATKRHPSSLPARRQLPHGVQRCPSCSFLVDVRSPAQANSSSPLPRSVYEFLRRKSKDKLVSHFRQSHLASSAKDNFNRRQDGLKVYFCSEPNCVYTHVRFSQVVSHFMGIHIKQSSASSGPQSYSCPEKNCSFTVDVTEAPRSLRISSQRRAKDSLAAHVFSAHELPAHPSLKTPLKRNNHAISLFVEVGSGTERRKAYRCTRCDYEDLLPEVFSNPEYKVSRSTFLRHFFDHHLRELAF